MEIKNLSEGEHTLDIKVYASRINTFGALHNANGSFHLLFDPNYWSTGGYDWCYEYILRPTGLLTAPTFNKI